MQRQTVLADYKSQKEQLRLAGFWFFADVAKQLKKKGEKANEMSGRIYFI